MQKYKVFKIKSNYISYYDNTKKDISEVLVVNYDKEKTGIQTLAFYYDHEKPREDEGLSHHSQGV